MNGLSINEIVLQYQGMTVEEISNLAPNEICAHLTILSSRLWSIGSEIVKTETNLAKKWIAIKSNSDSNKEADMLVKVTEEYAEDKKAKYCEKVVIELIRSLKKVLRSKEVEYQSYV